MTASRRPPTRSRLSSLATAWLLVTLRSAPLPQLGANPSSTTTAVPPSQCNSPAPAPTPTSHCILPTLMVSTASVSRIQETREQVSDSQTRTATAMLHLCAPISTSHLATTSPRASTTSRTTWPGQQTVTAHPASPTPPICSTRSTGTRPCSPTSGPLVRESSLSSSRTVIPPATVCTPILCVPSPAMCYFSS